MAGLFAVTATALGELVWVERLRSGADQVPCAANPALVFAVLVRPSLTAS